MTLPTRDWGWKCKRCHQGFMGIEPYILTSNPPYYVFKCNFCKNTDSVHNSLDSEGYEWVNHPSEDGAKLGEYLLLLPFRNREEERAQKRKEEKYASFV